MLSTYQAVTPAPTPHPPLPGNHSSVFCLYGFLDILYKWNPIIVAFYVLFLSLCMFQGSSMCQNFTPFDG